MQINGGAPCGCHHPGKSWNQKHCDSGKIMLLICNVTSLEYVFKVLCELLGGNPSWKVNIKICLVTIGLAQGQI